MTEAYNSRLVKARRLFIQSQFHKLNPQQQQAVTDTEGPLLLLAGAGSGKTTVLINRIANLISFGCASDSDEVPEDILPEDVEFLETYNRAPDPAKEERARAIATLHPVQPWNLIAITFTNKAANELKLRLETILGSCANDVWAMTFHAACCRILRRDIDRLGYDRSFTIYDTADSERVLKDILQEMNLDVKVFPPKSIMAMMGKAKDKMQLPAQFAKMAATSGDYRTEKIAKIYEAYERRLKESNALDFDDIILMTVILLQQCPDVLSFYQRKFQYVLIDEYQDTNHLQYLLASLLAGGHRNICVVGDDDQSIYRFRGATIENILSFEQQYQNSRVIRLEQNYRSTQSILNAANAVIANNTGRKGKTLWTSNGQGDPINVYEASTGEEEASYVASRVFTLCKDKNYSDFAILYRTNAQSNALEYALKRNGIPYRIIGGTRFFDRAEVKNMLAYLWVINNRADNLRLQRIINVPPRGIGDKTLEVAQRLASASQRPLYDIISEPQSYQALERAAKRLKEFTDLIENCAAELDTLPLPEFYDLLVERTGIAQMYELKNTIEDRTRLENVRELKSSIINYVENTESPTLGGFLEEIALYTDIEQYDADADAVVMMTMHSAKGLEFPNVCLVGFEEGLFPGMRAVGDGEEMEEERRLCYVAITRAKKTLSISYARQRMLYGRTTVSRPSRFIEELPAACIQKTGAIRTEPNLRGGLTGDHAYGPGHYSRPIRAVPSSDLTTPKKQAVSVTYRKGEMVQHSAFGQGMVLTVMPMGNDALLEIAFNDIGTKRLMANAASLHMHKL